MQCSRASTPLPAIYCAAVAVRAAAISGSRAAFAEAVATRARRLSRRAAKLAVDVRILVAAFCVRRGCQNRVLCGQRVAERLHRDSGSSEGGMCTRWDMDRVGHEKQKILYKCGHTRTRRQNMRAQL